MIKTSLLGVNWKLASCLVSLVSVASFQALADSPGHTPPPPLDPPREKCEKCGKKATCDKDPFNPSNGETGTDDDLFPPSNSGGGGGGGGASSSLPSGVGIDYSSFARSSGVLGNGWNFSYNQRIYETDQGRLIWRDPDGISVLFEPIPGQPGRYRSRSKEASTIEVNGDGSYTLSEGPDSGNDIQFDTDGRLTAIEDGKGTAMVLSYDPGGLMPVQAIPRHSRRKEVMTVIRDWRVLRVEEQLNGVPTGKAFDFVYDTSGHLASITDQGGRSYSFTYEANGSGSLVRVDGPEGSRNDYTYYSDQQSESKAYYGFMKTYTKAGCGECVVRTNSYDDSGRFLSQVQGAQGEGKEVSAAYYESAFPNPYTEVITKIKSVEGGVQLSERKERIYYTVDGFGNKRTLRKETLIGGVWTTTDQYPQRDPASGMITQQIKSNGGTIDYEYDADGRSTKETESVSAGVDLITETTYDARGNTAQRKTYQTDRPGEEFITVYEYYANSDLLHKAKRRKADSTFVTTEYIYTAEGLVQEVIDPRGNSMRYEYTTAADAPAPVGLLKREYDPANPAYQTLFVYDIYGNQTSISDAAGGVSTMQYDGLNRMVQQTDVLGNESHYVYDEEQLVEVRTGNPAEGYRTMRYVFNGLNQRTEVRRVDGAGQESLVSRNYYDTDGKVLMVENALGQMSSSDYDERGRLTQSTTPFKAGQDSVTKYTLDNAGRQTSVENAIGVVTNFEYDELGRRIRETQAVGTAEERVSEYDYNARGSQVQVRAYDAGQANLLATTHYYYNRLGRQLGVNWNPQNNDKSGDRQLPVLTEYDANGNRSAQTDGEGNSTQWQYDAYSRVERIIYPDTANYPGGNDVTMGYDDSGNQLWVRDGRGIYRYSHYDTASRLVASSIETDQDWSAIQWWNDPSKVTRSTTAFNAWGQPLTTVDVDGNTTTQSYDSFGRSLQVVAASGFIADYFYTALDQVSRVDFSPVGAHPGTSVITEYSAVNGRIRTASVDRAGNRTEFDYNADFTIKELIQSNNIAADLPRLFAYDALGRQSMITDELGNVTLYAYNPLGQLISTTFPDHQAGVQERIQLLTYTKYGQVETQTGAGGYPVKFAYDLAGNRLTQADAKGGDFTTGSVTTWAFDSRNRPTIKTYADSKTEIYSYDVNGQLASKTDGKGQQINFEYAADRNLQTKIDYPSDTDVVLTYDKARRRTTMTDATGLTEWTYDALGRLDIYKQHSVNRLIQYSYDTGGRATAMKVRLVGEAEGAAGEWVTDYAYDAAGRFADLTDHRISGTVPFHYDWHPDANWVNLLTMPSGANQQKTHDALGRLTRIEAHKANATTLNRYDYLYDAAGQRSQLTLLDGEVRAFGYNEKRELTSADSNTDVAYDYTYAFDQIGNREQSTIGGVTTTYTANNVNQYSQITDGTPVNPTYDNNGSLTDDGIFELVWDEGNRLVEARNTVTNQRVEYLYDGLGRRIERKVYDALTGGNLVSESSQLYSGWNSLMDVDGANAELETRTWGLDIADSTGQTGGVGALLARRKAGNGDVFEFFYDGNGNVVDLLDAAGVTVAHYEYDPFGGLTTQLGSEAVANDWRFSTKPQDGMTGLYYYGYRYYSAETGRWLSRDPIEERGGVNLYGFIGNDGVNKVDVLGLTIAELYKALIYKNVKKYENFYEVIGMTDAIDKIFSVKLPPTSFKDMPFYNKDAFGYTTSTNIYLNPQPPVGYSSIHGTFLHEMVHWSDSTYRHGGSADEGMAYMIEYYYELGEEWRRGMGRQLNLLQTGGSCELIEKRLALYWPDFWSKNRFPEIVDITYNAGISLSRQANNNDVKNVESIFGARLSCAKLADMVNELIAPHCPCIRVVCGKNPPFPNFAETVDIRSGVELKSFE